MTLSIKITPGNIGTELKGDFVGLGDRLLRALSAAMNMAASMIIEAGKRDIASAGNFGGRWTDGLTMQIEDGSLANMRMYLTHTIPWAGIFETGGTIQGKPLMWIPISGTDAAGVRASAFGGGLFSAKYPRRSGPPLLFAISDKKPRYFGIEEVTIPKKFQLTEDITSVMSNFRAIFDDAWKAA